MKPTYYIRIMKTTNYDTTILSALQKQVRNTDILKHFFLSKAAISTKMNIQILLLEMAS